MAKPSKGSNPHKTNLENVKKRYSETATDHTWFKVQGGTTAVVRILPPWGPSADGVFFYSGALHYGFDIGGQDNRTIPCTKERDKSCPVCILAKAAMDSEDEDIKKVGKRLRAKTKYWVNLIDRGYPTEIKMFGGNQKFIDSIKSKMEDDDYGDVTDPEDGHDLKIKRTGSGPTDTRYEYTFRPKPQPIDLEDWETKMHQLDQKVIEWMTFDEMVGHLKKNYGELMAEVEVSFKTKKNQKSMAPQEDEEEDEEPTPKKKKKLVEKTKPKDDDDDDDDDQEVDDDEKEDEDDE